MPKQRQYTIVALGGTFDMLHRGHEALITKALGAGERVIIGLTTDRMARSTRSHPVAGYATRRRGLLKFLEKLGAKERVEVVPLDDPYGPTVVNPDIRAIVVSAETAIRVDEINRIRRKRHLKPLARITVDMVLAEDGKTISTTRMVRGEIDRSGHLLKTMPKKSE